jgi:hypothetical protein
MNERDGAEAAAAEEMAAGRGDGRGWSSMSSDTCGREEEEAIVDSLGLLYRQLLSLACMDDDVSTDTSGNTCSERDERSSSGSGATPATSEEGAEDAVATAAAAAIFSHSRFGDADVNPPSATGSSEFGDEDDERPASVAPAPPLLLPWSLELLLLLVLSPDAPLLGGVPLPPPPLGASAEAIQAALSLLLLLAPLPLPLALSPPLNSKRWRREDAAVVAMELNPLALLPLLRPPWPPTPAPTPAPVAVAVAVAVAIAALGAIRVLLP